MGEDTQTKSLMDLNLVEELNFDMYFRVFETTPSHKYIKLSDFTDWLIDAQSVLPIWNFAEIFVI